MRSGATVDSDEEWAKVHRGYAVHMSEVRVAEPGESIERMVAEMLDGARAEDCVVWGLHANVVFTVHPADDPKSVLDAYWAARNRSKGPFDMPHVTTLRALATGWEKRGEADRRDASNATRHTDEVEKLAWARAHEAHAKAIFAIVGKDGA